ncbi:glycosyltransferase family 4 protein [Tabrizicola sp.]|uniref:glycosyltransferase family 4 protein n=1 Tax=Tabrizicola sp. TaxID=2005166 RepID=UPI003D266FA8
MVAARLLDLTRLVSRLGRGPMTGIDRVEQAYLTHLLAQDAPLYGLVRTGAGFLLLDPAGCAGFAKLCATPSNLPSADLLSRLMHRHDLTRARAETAARQLALARAVRPGLPRLLRHVPRGASYMNVGHANLAAKTLSCLSSQGFRVTVIVHDTIPLDHPEFARPGTVAPFRKKLAAVSAHASQILHLSHATQAQTEAQLARLGRVPPGHVAPLGVETARPDPAQLPPGLNLTAPYFVTLGTIEPRKNHALLLDVWERLPHPAPQLYIVGNRGWADPALLTRLDALPADGPIKLLHGLPDAAVMALVQGARALLAPSRAEGFGLPPLEAASLGTAVIAADLAVTRELLGNKAVYLPALDLYPWVETIARQTIQPQIFGQQTDWTPPTWAAHFKTVLSLGC